MAEKRTIELEIQDNSKTLKQQYKEAVVELQKMVVAYGEMSDEAINAAKRAAELKDQIEDTNDLMKTFKGEGAFIAMGKAMSSVASGFSAVEGGLALIGVESDKVQEAMLRVQAVMALAQGLEGLEDAGRAFKALGASAKTALKGIKTELIATGIGVFVVALGTAVAYWDDIKAAVGGVSDEQNKLNKQIDKDIAAQEHKGKMLDNQDEILKQQGKSEKEILQIKIKQIDGEIALAETKLNATKQTAKSEYEAAVRNRGYAEMFFKLWLEGQALIFRAMAAPIDMVLETANQVSEALGLGKVVTSNINKEISKLTESGSKFLANLLFDPAETKAKSDATIKELELGIQTMKNQKAGFENQITNLGKQGAKDRSNSEKDNAKEMKDIAFDLEEERIRLMEEGQQKELDSIKLQYARKKKEIEKDENILATDKKKLLDGLITSQQADEDKINEKYRKQNYDKQQEALKAQIKAEDDAWNLLQKSRNSKQEQELLELQQAFDAKIEQANGNAETEKAVTEQFNKEYAAINKRYQDEQDKLDKENAAKKKAEIKALNEYRVQSAQDTLQVVSNLAELFAGKSEKQQKKAFQVQKAVNIANAVIDTYKAANTALASSPPPFNYIAMAAAITAGLINVKKIASQQFQSSSSSSGSGGSNAPTGAAPMTANFNTIGSSGINQLAQLQQTPTQAYVVSGEVTSAQALDRNRVQNATL